MNKFKLTVEENIDIWENAPEGQSPKREREYPHSKTWLKREACDLMARLLKACLEGDRVFSDSVVTEDEARFMERYMRKEIQKLYNRGQPMEEESFDPPDYDHSLGLEYGSGGGCNDDGLY